MLVYVGERRETVSIHTSDTQIAGAQLLQLFNVLASPSNSSMMLSALCRGVKFAAVSKQLDPSEGVERRHREPWPTRHGPSSPAYAITAVSKHW